jgi:cytoskeletal protein RodZ
VNEERELTVGQYLRRERERKNISLESVAKVTRIIVQNLEALEKDEFHIFPAPIFARGFLRTYASYLGIDTREVLTRFEDQMKVQLPAKKVEEFPPSEAAKPLTKYLLILGVIIVGVGLLFALSPKKGPPSPQGLTPSASLEASPSPKIQGQKTAGEVAVKTAPEKKKEYVLKFKSTEMTWLRIQADNQPGVEALLKPGEEAAWKAEEQFKVTVGNAGGVEVFLNGVSQGRLGNSGEVVHLGFPSAKPQPSGEEKKSP